MWLRKDQNEKNETMAYTGFGFCKTGGDIRISDSCRKMRIWDVHLSLFCTLGTVDTVCMNSQGIRCSKSMGYQQCTDSVEEQL